MESPQCALNDLSRQEPRLYRALGFPPLPNGGLKSPPLPATASLSSWHVEVNPLAWRIRWVCPLGEPSLSVGFLPTHHLPNPPHLLPTGRAQSWECWRDSFPVILPEPVPGTQGRPHQCPPSSELLPSAQSLCTALWHTHSQEWAEEPQGWTGSRTSPPWPQQGPTAGQRELRGQSQQTRKGHRRFKSAPTSEETRIRARPSHWSGGRKWRRLE